MGLSCAAVAIFALALSPSRAESPPQRALPPMPSLSAIVERVMPAVVNISVSMRPGAPSEIDMTGDANLDRELRRFFEQNGQPDGPHGAMPLGHKMTALGSGFIIDATGYVVTNTISSPRRSG